METNMPRKAGSRFAGKKLFVLVPIVALLAAGCGAAQSVDNNNQPAPVEQTSTPPSDNTNTPGSANSAPSETINPSGSVWQGTLQASDNSANGNYMLETGGHKIYLRSSRDYSALVGKSVNVSYNGDLASFTLNDITAQ